MTKVSRTFRIDRKLSEALDTLYKRHGDNTYHVEAALSAYKPIKALFGKSAKAVVKTGNKQFKIPTPQEAGTYFLERGSIDAITEGDKFCDFYTAKNWYVGKNKMVDWKAAVRNWMRVKDERQQSANKPTVKQSIGNAIHGSTANDW